MAAVWILLCFVSTAIGHDKIYQGRPKAPMNSLAASVCTGQFVCRAGFSKIPPECINKQKVCDGHQDCGNGADEIGCAPRCSCSAGNYLCDDDKTCIPKKKVCDGEQQCPDGDDEKDCFSQCTVGQMICPGTGKCANVCNNVTECDRKEDEQDCAYEQEAGPSPEEIEQRLRDLIRQSRNEPLLISELESDGWMMVFRATSANGNPVHPAYTNGIQTTTIKPIDMNRSYDSHYRLSQLDTVWNNGLDVNKVKVGLYKNNEEVGYIIFDGVGSDYLNWFDESRIMESTWSDLTPDATYNFFSVAGDLQGGNLNRRFFINELYVGCPGDIGHLVIIDESKVNACGMDKQSKIPMILYSESNSNTFWESGSIGTADYFALFVM